MGLIAADVKEGQLILDQHQSRQASQSLEEANDTLGRTVRETYKWLLAPCRRRILVKESATSNGIIFRSTGGNQPHRGDRESSQSARASDRLSASAICGQDLDALQLVGLHRVVPAEVSQYVSVRVWLMRSPCCVCRAKTFTLFLQFCSALRI